MGWVMRSSNGITTLPRSRSERRWRNVPTTVGLRRSTTRAMRPKRRPSARGGASFHQHLVALHGPVDFVGRNEDVVVTLRLAGIRAHETIAVAMKVKAPREEVVAQTMVGRSLRRHAPHFAIEIDEFPARGQAGKLLEKQSPFPAAAQTQLTHKLLVTRLRPGGTPDAREQFFVGHASRVKGNRLMPGRIILGVFHPSTIRRRNGRDGHLAQFDSASKHADCDQIAKVFPSGPVVRKSVQPSLSLTRCPHKFDLRPEHGKRWPIRMTAVAMDRLRPASYRTPKRTRKGID